MTIRTRLTLQFVIIVAVIILLASLAVYFFSADHREEDFYNRLFNKGNSIAKLLIKVDEVDASLLGKMEEDNPGSLPKEKITVFDHNNTVLYSSDKNKEIQMTTDLLDKIRIEHSIRFRHGEHEALGFLFTDRYDRFVVMAAAEDIYGLRKLNNLKLILVAVFSCSVIVTFLSGWIYSGRALKPMSDVIERVNEISISKLDLRVDEGNQKDEIAQLAKTFNRMLSRLQASFGVQKNFIANASHELRTPLTAITGQLEVVQMKERSPDEYRKVLASVLDDIRNLNSISNRLLLLAQTDSEKGKADFKPLRIDEMLWQARSELLKRTQEYTVNISIDQNIVDEELLLINGNEQLIKIVLLNLMDNACKYSDDKKADVYLSNKQCQAELTFSDKGIGIPEEDLKHIFEPFHRAKNAISYKGHGIGLLLVKRIVSLHGGQVKVISGLGKGTVFTVIIPNK